jgi:hypothetical protein
MVKNEEEAILLSDNFKKDESGRMMLIGAKLCGSFGTYVNLMVDKLNNHKHSTYTDGDDLLLLNLFDGAEAVYKSPKKNRRQNKNPRIEAF